MMLAMPSMPRVAILGTPCVALALAVGRALAPLDDRQISVEEGVAHALHQRAALAQAEFLKVVKEDAADAALLLAVL